MNNEPKHLGVAVIVLKENKVLLGKRLNAYGAGLLGCPGGRLELTEPLIECAKRELLEETGVKATKLEYLGVIRELQAGYNFIHFIFFCTEWEGNITVTEPDKCESWEFYRIDKLPNNILRGHRAGITLAQRAPKVGYVDMVK